MTWEFFRALRHPILPTPVGGFFRFFAKLLFDITISGAICFHFFSLRTVFVIEVPKQCQISYSDTSEESPGDQLSGNQTHFERKLSLKAPQ